MIGQLPPLVTVAQRTPIARPMKRLDPLRSAGPRSSSRDPSTSVVVRCEGPTREFDRHGGVARTTGEINQIAAPRAKPKQQKGKNRLHRPTPDQPKAAPPFP